MGKKRTLEELDAEEGLGAEEREGGMEVDGEKDGSEQKPASKAKRIKKAVPAKVVTPIKSKKEVDKAKAATKKAVEAKAATKRISVKKEAGDAAPKKKKDYTKFEKLEEARKAFKWWDAEELPEGINWNTLEQAGIIFPEPYARHGKPLIYDGVAMVLPSEHEEIASFYAAMPEDGPQLGGPSRETFQKNFFKDFKAALGEASEIKVSAGGRAYV